MNVPLDHIAIQIYGPNRQLLGHCKVPAADIPDFAKVVAELKEKNPAFSPASMARWMMRLGLKGVKHALVKNSVPVPTGE